MAQRPNDEKEKQPSKLQELTDKAAAKCKEWVSDRVQDVKDWWNGPAWGQTHLGGMARQGLAELRGAFYAESNVAQPTDYGIYGRATPGETADLRREESGNRDLNEERPVQVTNEPHATVHGDANLKTHDAILPSKEDSATSWGVSKLEQKKQELSARDAIEPGREERDHDR